MRNAEKAKATAHERTRERPKLGVLRTCLKSLVISRAAKKKMVFTLSQSKEMRVLFPRLLFLHSISLLPCKLYPGFYKAPPPMSIKAS